MFRGDHLEKSTDLGLKDMLIQEEIQRNKTLDLILFFLSALLPWIPIGQISRKYRYDVIVPCCLYKSAFWAASMMEMNEEYIWWSIEKISSPAVIPAVMELDTRCETKVKYISRGPGI